LNYRDNLLHETWKNIDSDTFNILVREEKRQKDKLILSAALSIAPYSVREANGSIFSNIDAEGHLPKWIENESLEQLFDLERQIKLYNKFSDKRPNKNTEYANVIEKIAQKRIANLFCTEKIDSSYIHVNVQPPTGAIANSIALEAVLNSGDTLLSMSLSDGGHLSHGSKIHQSSKKYNVIHYGIDPKTGKIDYENIKNIASKIQPKLIIAGASSYPWEIEWDKLKKICEQTQSKPYLMADIAHTAGLVVGGMFPNPIEFADIITMVTYKTFCGPRAAAILTTDCELSKRINRTTFPGMLGSPIFQNIVALAISAKIAETEEFKILQRNIVQNAKLLSKLFKKNGISVAFEGTNSHIVIIDLKKTKGLDKNINGEIAAKVLEECNIICNKNMLPGDKNAAEASGIRLGTTWISQLGIQEYTIHTIVENIVGILNSIQVTTEKQSNLVGNLPINMYTNYKKSINHIINTIWSN